MNSLNILFVFLILTRFKIYGLPNLLGWRNDNNHEPALDMSGFKQEINLFYTQHQNASDRNHSIYPNTDNRRGSRNDNDENLVRHHNQNNLHIHQHSPDSKWINESFDEIAKKFKETCEKFNELSETLHNKLNKVVRAVNANTHFVSSLKSVLGSGQNTKISENDDSGIKMYHVK